MKNDDNRLDVNFFRKEENLSCPKETDIFDLRTYAEELVKQMFKCESDGCEILVKIKEREFIVGIYEEEDEPECNKDCDNCPLNEENGSCDDER